jgi:hypothetical protein
VRVTGSYIVVVPSSRRMFVGSGDSVLYLYCLIHGRDLNFWDWRTAQQGMRLCLVFSEKSGKMYRLQSTLGKFVTPTRTEYE